MNILAKFYAARHQNYCDLMTRLRKFIAAVKIDDQNLRRKAKKAKNPIEDENKGKIQIDDHILGCCGEASYRRPKIREVNEKDFINKADLDYGEKIRNFLSHTAWTDE